MDSEREVTIRGRLWLRCVVRFQDWHLEFSMYSIQLGQKIRRLRGALCASRSRAAEGIERLVESKCCEKLSNSGALASNSTTSCAWYVSTRTATILLLTYDTIAAAAMLPTYILA